MEWVLKYWEQSPGIVIAAIFFLIGGVIPGIFIFISLALKKDRAVSSALAPEPKQEAFKNTLKKNPASVAVIDYTHCAHPSDSVALLEKQSNMSEKAGDKQSLLISLLNMAAAQICLGEFEEAGINLKHSVKLGSTVKNDLMAAAAHQELGRLLVYQGEFEQAAGELELASLAFEKQNNFQAQSAVSAYSTLAASLGGDYTRALERAEKTLVLANKTEDKRSIIQAEWLMGMACRGNEKLTEAQTHINKALTYSQHNNVVEFEANIILELAHLSREQSILEQPLTESPEECASTEPCACNADSEAALEAPMNQAAINAHNLAKHALEIADRCQYRLQQADIHLFLAQLALDREDNDTALCEAEKAYERASCGYKPALDAANMYKKLVTVKCGCSCHS